MEPLTLLFFLLALGLLLLTTYKDNPTARIFALILSGFALVTVLTDTVLSPRDTTLFVIIDAAMILYNVVAGIWPRRSR